MKIIAVGQDIAMGRDTTITVGQSLQWSNRCNGAIIATGRSLQQDGTLQGDGTLQWDEQCNTCCNNTSFCGNEHCNANVTVNGAPTQWMGQYLGQC